MNSHIPQQKNRQMNLFQRNGKKDAHKFKINRREKNEANILQQ